MAAHAAPDFGTASVPDQIWAPNTQITDLVLPQAMGGDAPVTYTLAPALPAGLTFTAATRTISGTPTAAAARTTYTLTAEDSDNDTDTLTFAITVAVDYDADDDNLIEVSNLEQLNAIRWDLDGNGASSDTGYADAFPDAADGMGCPRDTDSDATTPDCLGYELTADLDFDDAASYASGSVNTSWTTGDGWEPIGTSSGSFAAEFNGGGHVVRNLFIDRDGTDNVGLFGHAGRNSHLLRVGMEEADVTGQHQVGALVGYTAGDVRFSYSSGSVTGYYSAGGLVGEMKSPTGTEINEVSASYSTARVRGRENVGGLVGVMGLGGTGSDRSAVVASYATGSVEANEAITSGTFTDFGGLLGWCRNCELNYSYARGAVSGGPNGVHIGGLLGGYFSSTSFSHNHFDGDTSGRVFGVGHLDSDDDNVVDSGETVFLAGRTTAELQAPTGYTGIYASWNRANVDGVSGSDDAWDFGTAAQYPALKVDFDGDGIASAAEFGDQPRSAGASIAWAGGFTETATNDGTVEGSVTATLTGDTFVSNVLTLAQAITQDNVPDGLSLRSSRTSSTLVTFTMTGSATNHVHANDVGNLSIAFGDAAFTDSEASAVTHSSKNDLTIDFNDPAGPVDAMPTFGAATVPDQSWTQNTTITNLVLPPATGGDAPVTYSLSPALPAGLTFAAATRTISGTPTAPKTQTAYTLTATDSNNDTDTLTFNIAVAAAPPTGVTVGTVTDNSIEVSWTAPAGVTVTDYDLDYRVADTADWTGASQGGATTTNTVASLASCTFYEFRVRAESNSVESAWTAPVRGRTTGTPKAPGKPNVRATPRSRTSLDVSWRAPDDCGAVINDYDLRYREDGTSSWTDSNTGSTATQKTIAGLADGTRYEVQVRAQSNRPASPWSPSGFGTAGRIVFTSPDSFTVKENYTGVGDVTARDNDGHRIVGYELSGADAARFNNAFGRLSFRSAPDYENPRDANGDNRYHVTVTATSGTGDDEESASQDITVTVTNVDRPATPRDPGFANRTRTSLEFEWRPPSATGGDRVNRYEVRHRRAGTSAWSHQTRQVPRYQDGRSRFSTYLTGLEANTRYEAHVRAANTEGGGPWSARATGTTASVPAAPTPTIGTVAATRIEVRWTAPDDGGSAIEEYTLAHGLDGGGLFTLVSLGANARSTTVDGLEPSTRYQFKMRARNAEGWSFWSARVRATTEDEDPEEPPVAGFTLVDADGADLRALADGGTVPAGLGRVDIRADIRSGASVGSVRLRLAGPVTAERTESVAPYELWGGQGGEELVTGSYTLTATPYEESGGNGAELPARTVSFEVVEDSAPDSPVAGFTLVDGAGGGDIQKIADGDTLAADLGRVDIRADIRAGESVGSVRLYLYGPVTVGRTENIEPYELWGGQGGEELLAGSYTLRATPYEEASAQGAKLPRRTVSFEVAAPAESAVVDGAVLTLTFASPRDAFAPPDGSDFVVRADGALRAVTGTSLSGNRALLTLDAPVVPEQAVFVDYVGAAMHPLADARGVETPAWTDLEAVNVTALPRVEGIAPDVPVQAAVLAGLALSDPAPAERTDLPGSLSLAGLGLGDADLVALRNLGGLRRMDLSDNALTDLSALAGLAGLRSLDLSGNAVADLWPLAGLAELRRLDLSGNAVADLAPLAGLPRLEVLVVAGNRVTDIGALTHHARLRQLDLADNAVADLAPLADLVSLRRLDLGSNPAADLSPVADVGTLVWLRLPTGADVAPLGRLVRLRWLWRGSAGACLACPRQTDPVGK